MTAGTFPEKDVWVTSDFSLLPSYSLLPHVATFLVTGAAGFIGFHLCRRLLAVGGRRVVGIDNFNDYYDPTLKEGRAAILRTLPGMDLRTLDFRDAESVGNLFDAVRPDVIVHLGAQAGVRYSTQNPRTYVENNLTGFFNIAEAALRLNVRHFVYASSSTVYGNSPEQPFREDMRTDSPVSFYGATKKANEVMAHALSHTHGLRTTGIRFFTVYGPWGRPDLGVSVFAEKILAGETLSLFNAGKNLRDFTFIDDVVEILERVVVSDPLPGEPLANLYNIGNQKPVEILELVRLLEQKLGRAAKVELAPAAVGDMPVTHADSSRVRQRFGCDPHTPLSVGLDRYIEWLKEWKTRQNTSNP